MEFGEVGVRFGTTARGLATRRRPVGECSARVCAGRRFDLCVEWCRVCIADVSLVGYLLRWVLGLENVWGFDTEGGGMCWCACKLWCVRNTPAFVRSDVFAL